MVTRHHCRSECLKLFNELVRQLLHVLLMLNLDKVRLNGVHTL